MLPYPIYSIAKKSLYYIELIPDRHYLRLSLFTLLKYILLRKSPCFSLHRLFIQRNTNNDQFVTLRLMVDFPHVPLFPLMLNESVVLSDGQHSVRLEFFMKMWTSQKVSVVPHGMVSFSPSHCTPLQGYCMFYSVPCGVIPAVYLARDTYDAASLFLKASQTQWRKSDGFPTTRLRTVTLPSVYF